MKHVLCAVDLSDVSTKVLRCAHVFVQRHGDSLTVLHVEPTFDAKDTQDSGWLDPAEVGRPKAIKNLRQAVVEAGLPSDRVRYEAHAGDPR